MQVIIDRFEGDFAVVELEEGLFINMDKRLLPQCKEGDVIDIAVNQEETENRKSRIKKLSDSLFED